MNFVGHRMIYQLEFTMSTLNSAPFFSTMSHLLNGFFLVCFFVFFLFRAAPLAYGVPRLGIH